MSFPTFLMSFAASHSGCQVSTKIGATPAHTGKVHTQVVSCLCFVSTQRNETSKLLHFWPNRVEFRYLRGSLLYLGPKRGSKSGNCRTGSLWTEHISWVLAHSCPKNATVTRFRCGAAYSLGFGTLEAGILATVVLLPLGLSENCFSVSSVQERIVLLASQLLPSTLIGSNNVKLRGW